MKRIWPGIALFFIAPLVAEFLLGDLPIDMLGSLSILAPLYGGGALLIREVVRRTGGDWPNIVVLGSAYALFEEAFTTQTLFNPNYLHLNLHLLQPAYIPPLGIGVWWTMHVLTLHTVWSISVSIALAESLVPEHETTPWLGRAGLAVTVVFFLLGAAASTAITLKFDPFLASKSHFAIAALICAILVVVSFRLPRRATSPTAGSAPVPLVTRHRRLGLRIHLSVGPAAVGMGHRRHLRGSLCLDDCPDPSLVTLRRLDSVAPPGARGRRGIRLCLACVYTNSRRRQGRHRRSHRQRDLRRRPDCGPDNRGAS